MNKFKKAEKKRIWLKVLLNGSSGSGKSYTALRLATGIASKCDSRIAYIGTESSRDMYYAKQFDYDLLQLDEPFSCEKYMEAIDNAIEAGYKVLIIDSLSHEWKWLNDVHDKMPGNSFTNWGKLKSRHHNFMEKVLRSPIHVIATARGKDEWVLEEKNGKQVPKKVGMGTVQDKETTYNYTLSFVISQDTHIATADKDNTGGLYDNKYEILTEKDGVQMWEWANDGEGDDPMIVQPSQQQQTVAYNDDTYITQLEQTKNDIIAICKQLGGTKNAELMSTLKQFVKNGNPKGLKDVETAQNCLLAVQQVRPLVVEEAS